MEHLDGITQSETGELLKVYQDKKRACKYKISKLGKRIKLLDDFLAQSKKSDLTFRQWLKRKGYEFDDFFVPVGWHGDTVVSLDSENKVIPELYEGFAYNKEIGYPLPKRERLQEWEHDEVTSAMNGYTFNPELSQYFPTTKYDNYQKSLKREGTEVTDILGGLSIYDIGDLAANDETGETAIVGFREYLKDEADNLIIHYDVINQDLSGLGVILFGRYSSAEGGKNAACRTGCAVKHPFDKKKRKKCQDECDKKHEPTNKQSKKREDAEKRKEARKSFREEKKELRDLYKSGKISKDEYKKGKKEERKEKREAIKEAGGNFLQRSVGAFAKFFPITAAARKGALILIEQNAFQFALKMYPAFATGEDLNKFKADAPEKSKKAWEKLKKAWKGLGGDSEKLKKAIIKGWNKKEKKIEKKEHSNFVGGDVLTILGAGATLLSSLMGLVGKIIDKKPLKDGGVEDINNYNDFRSPDMPVADENGNWIDPETGRRIDPQTGEETIMGISKTYFWIGLSAIAITTVAVIIFSRNRNKGK